VSHLFFPASLAPSQGADVLAKTLSMREGFEREERIAEDRCASHLVTPSFERQSSCLAKEIGVSLIDHINLR
jgi:hypothetical protein